MTIALYSAGSTLGSKGRKTAPSLVDFVMIIAICVVAANTRHLIGTFVFYPLWIVSVPLIATVASFRHRKLPLPDIKTNDTVPTSFLGNAKAKWLNFSHQAGGYSSRVMLTGFYFIFVTPYAIAIRLLSDPLELRKPKSGTMWVKRESMKNTMSDFRKQF